MEEFGAPSVTEAGATKKLMWHADSWDFLQFVGSLSYI